MTRLVSIAALVVLASCSVSTSQSTDFTGDAESAIRRADSQFSANVRAGNAQVLVDDFYAPDAVVMAPNVPAFHGRDAIRGFWAQNLAAGSADLALITDSVTQSCSDMAVESGHYDVTITPRGGQAIHEAGKYVVVWKKNGGRWWATRDIFNSDSK
jgi:ketosteroid isomerase-like protein